MTEFNDRRPVKPLAVLSPRDKSGNALYPDTSGYGHEVSVHSVEEFNAVLGSKKMLHRLDDSTGEWSRAKPHHYVTRHGGRDHLRYPAGGTIADHEKV
jgi:hypothetical protein